MPLAALAIGLWAVGGGVSVSAAVHKEAVRYQHGDVELQGYLAYDDAAAGKRPGVLVIHEWWGLNDYTKSRVDQLAGLGYVAFALDMYGKGYTTADPEDAKRCSGEFYGDPMLWRQRAKAGLDVLMNQDRVDPSRVAVIGYCFGGTTALQLAYSGADLKGAVSFHGSLPLPGPADTPRIKAKILVCHGANDTMIPAERIGAFQQAMREAGLDWQFISYSNAVHSFTNPRAGGFGVQGVDYNPEADRRSWQHMRQFFDEIFGR